MEGLGLPESSAAGLLDQSIWARQRLDPPPPSGLGLRVSWEVTRCWRSLRASQAPSYNDLMKGTLITAALAVALAPAAFAQPPRPAAQPGALTDQMQELHPEVLISTLPAADLTKRLTTATGAIQHEPEVARGEPVAAVVRTTGCVKDTTGACRINADVVTYGPDGTVFHEARRLDLPEGRDVVPLEIEATSATGVYKVVVTVRDLTARRFATVERQFGVK